MGRNHGSGGRHSPCRRERAGRIASLLGRTFRRGGPRTCRHEEGYLNFEVPYGFNGYVFVDMKGQALENGLLPILVQINRPLLRDWRSYATSAISKELMSIIGQRADEDVVEPPYQESDAGWKPSGLWWLLQRVPRVRHL